MRRGGRWSDLGVRLASGFVMATLGLAAVWLGGHVFIWFVSALAGLMVWELVRLLAPRDALLAVHLGLLSALCGVMAIYFPAGLALPTLLIPILTGVVPMQATARIYVPFVTFILAAAFGMMSVRNEFGVFWMLWLVLVVAGTDIAGYFAGRLIGGPKFWSRVSPSKTWAGTVAGWIVAALIGLAFQGPLGGGTWLIALSVVAAVASQAGDIAESAVKRKMGVKDSSDLIPGHGGVLDRFDGMMGASVAVLIVMETTGYPPGPV